MSSAAPRRATTTPIARTTSCRGSTGRWTSGSEEFLEVRRARLIRLRRQQPVFSRRRYVKPNTVTPEGLKEIIWLTPDGREMTENDWNQEFARCLGVYLRRRGDRAPRTARQADPGQQFSSLLFNAHHETIPFTIAETLAAKAWVTVLDTAAAGEPFARRRSRSRSSATRCRHARWCSSKRPRARPAPAAQLRPSDSHERGHEVAVKIVTYNVNGIGARLPNLRRWLDETRPDVVCLQELKERRRRKNSRKARSAMPATASIWHGQKSWNGVAILARTGPSRSRSVAFYRAIRRTSIAAISRPRCAMC